MNKRTRTLALFTRLRAAGVPRMLTGHEAWHLSGGIVGAEHDSSLVSLAALVTRAPDAEAFLADWQEVAR